MLGREMMNATLVTVFAETIDLFRQTLHLAGSVKFGVSEL